MTTLIETTRATSALRAERASARLSVALLCLAGRRIDAAARRWIIAHFIALERPETLRLEKGAGGCDLEVGDILGLSARERLDFVRGAMALLHTMSRGSDLCICHMPALVQLTVAALASLMIAGETRRAEAAFKSIRKVTLFCAESVGARPQTGLNTAGSYREFVAGLSDDILADASTDASRHQSEAGRKLLASYRIQL